MGCSGADKGAGAARVPDRRGPGRHRPRRCPQGRGRACRGSIPLAKREFFIDNLLVRIHLIIEMISVDQRCTMGG